MRRSASKKHSRRSGKPAYDRFETRKLLAVLTGTVGDDIVSVTATGDVLEVDINGDMHSFDFATDPTLDFNGLGGSDLVTLDATDGSPIEFIGGELKVGVFTVDLINTETVEVANDGRILIRGTANDDQFILSHSPAGSTVSVNGSEHSLPLTEQGLPLQLDADAGSDNLLLRVDDYSGGFLQVKIDSATRSDLIDLAWSEMEHVELEFIADQTGFSFISDDVNDVMYVDTDRITVEGATTTFEAARNLTGTGFWHSGGGSNEVFVRGTENDDTFEFTYNSNNQILEVNGNHAVYLNYSSTNIDGDAGDDSIEFNLDEDRIAYVGSAVIEPAAITVKDFPAVTWDNIESQAAGNMDEVTILDSAGDDHIEAFHSTVITNIGGTTWTLTDNDVVDIASTGGTDSIVALTSPDFFAAYYNYQGLGIDYQGFDHRFLATDFDDITIRSAEPGGFAYYGGAGIVDEFEVSDPNGNLLVELGDRVPVLFEGEMNIRMQGFADDAKFNFTSAMEASQVQARFDEVVINESTIELIDIDSIEAIGDDPEDRITLLGTPGADWLTSGVPVDAAQKTTRLTDRSREDYEIVASGFEHTHAVLDEGSDVIQFVGSENVAETVEIGFTDLFSISMDGYNLVVDRGDFLTTETSIADLQFGFGPEDTFRFVGSPDHADSLRISITEEVDGTLVNEFNVYGEIYDSFSPAGISYLFGSGFGSFEADLAGGGFTAGDFVFEDWLSLTGSSANGVTEVWPGQSGTLSMSATDISWQNIKRLGAAGPGLGRVYDSGLDEAIVFGPEEDSFNLQNEIFPFNGVDVVSSDLKSRYAFGDTIYFSTASFDTADLSVDANTIELGLNTTRATWAGVNLTLDSVDEVNVSTENDNDVAEFTVDVGRLDVRVSDDRNVQFTSPSTSSVVNVSTFGTLNINDNGANVVSFLTDTTSNGTTTASMNEVVFSQIPDSDLNFPLAGVSRIELIAGTNSSNLIVTGTAEDEGLAIRESEIELFGPSYSIRAVSYPDISVAGEAGNDVIGLESEFESTTDGDALVFENANLVVRTMDFESFASVPNLDNISVNGGASQRSSVNSLELTFSGSVEIDPGAFSVIQRSDGDGTVTEEVVSTSFTCAKDGDTIVTLTFGSNTRNGVGDLEDGNYQLTIDGTKIRRTGTNLALGGEIVYGDSADESFYALYGDTNGDRTVNVFDLFAFRGAFSSAAGDGMYNASLDYGADGRVNVIDLLRFRTNYRKSLPFV